MKRAVSLVLIIAFAMFGFCGIVFAEDEISPLEEITPERWTGGLLPDAECVKEISDIIPMRTRGTQKPLKEHIEEQLLSHPEDEKIDLIGYGCVYNSDFMKMFNNIIMSNYRIMAITGIKEYGGWQVDDNFVLAYVKPRYMFDTLEEDIEKREFMEEQIRTQYLANVSDIPATDVLGKMLVIHDLFCKNNAYAHEELAEFDRLEKLNELKMSDYIIYTAYGLFKNNRAVCQGNSIALKGIYDALNEQLKQELGTDEDIIKTAFCSSNRKAHIWNVVKIGDKWYHLDETWNDNSQYEEYALHKYFLVSDDKMSDHIDGVCDWEYYSLDVECNDKKYEDGYFFSDLATTVTSVSYESGMYSIYTSLSEQPFCAYTLKSTELLITDPFVEDGVTRIRYFAREDVTFCIIIAKYNAGGQLTKFSKLSPKEFQGNKFYNLALRGFPSECRLFHWSQEGMTPLCRATEIE